MPKKYTEIRHFSRIFYATAWSGPNTMQSIFGVGTTLVVIRCSVVTDDGDNGRVRVRVRQLCVWSGLDSIAGVCLSVCVAVQNERDRISVRRSSYDDITQAGALSVGTLHSAELLSRQVEPTLHSLS